MQVLRLSPIHYKTPNNHNFSRQVFCVDCDKLVVEAMTYRGLSPSSCDIHCGFDGGQGVLKLALTITDRLDDVPTTGRSCYSDVSNRSSL